MEAAVSERGAVALAAAVQSPEYAFPTLQPRVALQLVQQADAQRTRDEEDDVRPRESGQTAIRALNVVIASIGLILGSPLILLVGLAGKRPSPGPAPSLETRAGGGRPPPRR